MSNNLPEMWLWRPPLYWLLLVFLTSLSGACESPDMGPAVATPALDLSQARVPLGAPVRMTYRFTVSPEIGRISESYRVLVHFLDTDGALLFTDNHHPPLETTNWRPGRTVTYERRTFIPVYPYVGESSIALGLYSPAIAHPVALAGDPNGHGVYIVATIELAPPPASFLRFQDGWHSLERDGERAWRWSSEEATFTFRNPRQDSRLHFELQGRPGFFESPQRVQLLLGDDAVDNFVLDDPGVIFRSARVSAGVLGEDDTAVLTLRVDQTFVPAALPASKDADTRRLGVRVFHAFLEVPVTQWP